MMSASTGTRYAARYAAGRGEASNTGIYIQYMYSSGWRARQVRLTIPRSITDFWLSSFGQ